MRRIWTKEILLGTLILTFSLNSQGEDLRPIGITNQSCSPKVETCGNSIDEDCNGSDEQCPGSDKDADGFIGSSDCDDLDPLIHVGTSTSCNATCGDGYKTCLSTGSFSSCTCSILCEATGGGRCFYVDPVRGNNTNQGSFESRKKDLSSFSAYGSGSSKINLIPGDMIYIFSGILKTAGKSSVNNSILTLIGTNGNLTNKITISNYPGNTPILSGTSTSPSIEIINSSHINIYGLNFKPEGTPLNIESSSNITFKNLSVENSSVSNTPVITLSNSNFIQFYELNIFKNFINPSASDIIMQTNSNNVYILHSFIE